MSSEGASTSTAESKEKMDATVEALNMLAQGKRNLLCQEVPTAVQQFQEACQKLSTSYGELAKECADAYYYYGVGLLELSRMESGVLGNALQGVDVDADENADEPDDKEMEQFEPTDKLTEDARDKLRDQVYDAMAEDEKKVNGQDSREIAVKESAPKVSGDAEPMDVETEKAESESTEVKSENKSEKNETSNGNSINEPDIKKDTEDMVITDIEKAGAGKGEFEDSTGKTNDINGHAPKENGDVQMKTEGGKKTDNEVKKQEDSTTEEKEMKDEAQAEKENITPEKSNGDASEECKKEDEDKNEKKDTTEKTFEDEKELNGNGEKTKSASKDLQDTTEKTEDEKELKENGNGEKTKSDSKDLQDTTEKTTEDEKELKKNGNGEKTKSASKDLQDTTEKTEDEKELKENENGEKTKSASKNLQETADGKKKGATDEKDGVEDEKMDVQDDKDEKKADAKVKSSAGEADQEKEKEGEAGEEKEGEDGEAEGEEEEGEEDGETAEGEEEAAEGEEEGGDEENKDGEDPDDVPNLQLAWEMLELSKVIYLKAESKESKLKAAQSYLKLGEVSMETESYEQAVEDLKTCLKIQEENLDPDDRLIAETHYHLALAYQLNKQFENAIDHFRAAVKCLESKIEFLKKVVEEKPPQDPSEFIDAAQKAAEEIKDIEKILPDIRDKIEDAQEELRSVDNLKLMAKEAMGQVLSSLDSATETGFTSTSKSSASPTKSADDKKTSDISHLIRKKRKPEDEAAEEDLDNKKPRQEGATGDAESKPVAEQNGHVEKPEDKPAETAEPMATG